MPHTPLVLAILDGYGHRDERAHNAVALAHAPTLSGLWSNCPHTLLQASGTAVGLPAGQMGNSEVGHLSIGSGRIIRQELTRINYEIETGAFFNNPVLVNTLLDAKTHHRQIHVLILLSPGGVHSDEQHFYALCRLAAQTGVTNLRLHAILDGRDTPPKSAESSLLTAEKLLRELNVGTLASISGRYYAMDRDKRYERTALYHDMLVTGAAPHQADNAFKALHAAYERGETDEFVLPTTINSALSKNAASAKPSTENVEKNAKEDMEKGGTEGVIISGDSVIFLNFRSDRARQLTEALINTHYSGFQRKAFPALAHMVSLTQYADTLKTEVAYTPEHYPDVLGECLAKHGLAQCRIAETEKYAHVTFFFNGGEEPPFAQEDRVLVPSPKIATYDMQPSMSAPQVTEKVLEAILSKRYAVIVVNFANADMVGHTGKLDAAIAAIETLDACLANILHALDTTGGELILTADHGNAEYMFDPATGQPHTAHTSEPVPFIYRGRAAHITTNTGSLCDIAPTILKLLNIPVPSSMSGQSLLDLNSSSISGG